MPHHLKTTLVLTLLAIGYGPWATAAELTIKEPWARATVSGQLTSAAYAMMMNDSDAPIKIIGAYSPIAGRTELHGHEMHENGRMEMIKLASINIPAKGKVHFKPMSFHVMFFGLKNPLKINNEVPVTLFFEDGTQQSFRAPIKPLSHRPKYLKNMKETTPHANH